MRVTSRSYRYFRFLIDKMYDIWRELMEKDNRDDVDEAWTAFRKQLELGREIEVVDENGDRIEYGDYPDEEDPEYD